MERNTSTLFWRMLDVVEKDIVPLTRDGVRQGHKVFGAAVLRADDLSLVLAGTNHEAECPLWSSFLELFSLEEMIPSLANPGEAQARFERLRAVYLELSEIYQATKERSSVIARK